MPTTAATAAATANGFDAEPEMVEAAATGTGRTAVVLVIGNPEATEFSLLQQLPTGVQLLGIGKS